MSTVREVAHRRRVIDSTLSRARALATHADAPALQADYARHICVLVSGFVERAVAELIVAYAEDKAARPIKSYLDATLSRVNNLDKDRLLRVIGALDASWADSLDSFIDDKRQAALNSIVGLRNDIAHGGGGSLSLRGVEQYWLSVQEIVDHVEQLLFPTPPVFRTRAKR